MVGRAAEISYKEIPYVMKLLQRRIGKPSAYYTKNDPKEYSGSSPVRLYKFVPAKFWILGKSVNVKGKLVDMRREVHVKKS